MRPVSLLIQILSSPHFIEHGGSLPHLQESVTCPCPESGQSRRSILAL